MPFLDQSALDANLDQPELAQRGRAALEMLSSLQRYSSTAMRTNAQIDFESDPDGQALIEAHERGGQNIDWEERIDRAREVASRSSNYRTERLMQRYVAEELWAQGVAAVEERRGQFEKFVQWEPENPLGSLELDPDLSLPEYWDEEWHLQPGNWDGYDLYGPLLTWVATPYIFINGGYAAVGAGANIVQQRIDVVSQLPKKKYERVYEPGCGGFSTLAAVWKVFPEAELVGSDLSPLSLTHGHKMAERMGAKVAFKQRNAVDTKEPSESFDAVVMYALMHEMPYETSLETFREAFRILKPGGDLVINDPPPFRAVSPFQQVILDWDTEHRGEPYFSIAARANWAQELRDIGFSEAEDYALDDEVGYPFVTRARK